MIPPAVVKGQVDRLSIRVIDPLTSVEITPTGVKISVYRSGTSPVFADLAASFDDSLAYFDRDWVESFGTYRAVWAITHATGSFPLEQYFEVVAHKWRAPIGPTDFKTKYPYLEKRLPQGSTFADFLSSAWSSMGTTIYSRIGKHPGCIQHPEQFGFALELMAVADIYRSIYMQPNSSQQSKGNEYRELAVVELEAVLARIHADLNDDLSPDEDEDGLILSDGRLARLRASSFRRMTF